MDSKKIYIYIFGIILEYLTILKWASLALAEYFISQWLSKYRKSELNQQDVAYCRLF